MMLSDGDLARAILDGQLALTPFDPHMIQPASIDLRLSGEFLVFNDSMPFYDAIDPSEEQTWAGTTFTCDDGVPLLLAPGEFVLGSTVETVQLGNQTAGRIEGKSSLGRLGLEVHRTAGFIDPGFHGAITLEMSNVRRKPIRLWPGMKIAQLCAFRLSSPAANLYGSAAVGSRYQGQRGPTASRSHENWRTWPTSTRRVAA